MNETGQGEGHPSDVTVVNIQLVRSRLVDYGLIFFAVPVPLALFLSLLRSSEHGWHPILTFHIFVACVVVASAVFRKRLSYRVRVSLLLAVSLIVGVAGLLAFGLLGAGIIVLIVFAVMTAVALGTRAGLIACAFVLSIVVFTGVAVNKGVITNSFDIAEYATSLTAWGTIFAGLIMFLPATVIALGFVQSQLATSLKNLQESHEKHERIVSNLADTFLYRHDVKGVFTYVSSSVTQVLGYRPEEFLTHFADIFTEHPVNHEAVMRSQQSINGIQQPRYEMQVFHSDGKRRWLEVAETPVCDRVGTVVSVEGIAHDITNRKHTDEELRRLAVVIEQSAETVVITDTDGTIIYVNPAFERNTGFSRDEAVGENPRILKSDMTQASVFSDLWETIVRGETWTGRLINKKKNGTLFTEDTTISPLRSSSGELVNFVAVKRDVTRELELENQLFQSQKMEAIGQLAGGVAHDFNNLLQGIQGFGEMAQQSVKPDSRAHDCLIEMMKATERATTLVSQLLAFSRRQVLVMEDVNLNDAIADLMGMISLVLGEHISLDLVPGHSLGVVRGDRGQISQILMNLCVNARDAMPAGGRITIETENVRIDRAYCESHAWHVPGRYVLLSVTDTGCGMDDETREKIFEPFFTTKDLGEGTGLGLSTVYGLVKQHDGQVHVYSEINKGTTFKIYLPMIERSAATVGPKIKGAVVGGVETILVAEDDKTVRRMSRRILEQAGYTVLTARDGEDAVRVFEEHAGEIELALLDVVMPRFGGPAVYEHIREANSKIGVLFTSGYGTKAIHKDFVLEEGLQFISKPYHSDDLLRNVRDVLDSATEHDTGVGSADHES